MRILITGATGFVGSHLVARLLDDNKSLTSKRQYAIRILMRRGSKLNNIISNNDAADKLEIVYGDLTDNASLLNATKDVDIVFHLAALLGSPEITYSQIYDANVKGTQNLLRASEKNKVKRFIHISSVAAMGPIKQGMIADEKTPCNPVSDYDKTKYLAELAVKESKLRWTIIRPTTVYGPGEIKNKAKMFSFIKKGLFRIIGDGKNMLALVYIDDLIEAILLAAHSNASSCQTYIISGDYSGSSSCTMNNFVATIATHLQVNVPGHMPLWLAKTAALCFKTLRIFKVPQLLSSDRIRSLTNSSSFSIAKARKELGYSPKVSLDEGIARTVSWYEKNNIL
jgi:nucleoside-diphosphate-sugar epimerase